MPARLPAGLRRNLVRVEIDAAALRARPRGGDYTEDWQPSGPLWSVAIEAGGGGERKQAGTSIGQATHTITGAYRGDISIRARLVRGAQVFNIVEVADRDDRRHELVCRCQEVIP